MRNHNRPWIQTNIPWRKDQLLIEFIHFKITVKEPNFLFLFISNQFFRIYNLIVKNIYKRNTAQ